MSTVTPPRKGALARLTESEIAEIEEFDRRTGALNEIWTQAKAHYAGDPVKALQSEYAQAPSLERLLAVADADARHTLGTRDAALEAARKAHAVALRPIRSAMVPTVKNILTRALEEAEARCEEQEATLREILGTDPTKEHDSEGNNLHVRLTPIQKTAESLRARIEMDAAEFLDRTIPRSGLRTYLENAYGIR